MEHITYDLMNLSENDLLLLKVGLSSFERFIKSDECPFKPSSLTDILSHIESLSFRIECILDF